MAGPVVREASQSFDQFRNDEASYPIALLSPDAVNPRALQATRETLARAARSAPDSDYGALVRSDDAVGRLLSGDWTLDWTDEYRFVSDEPSKVRQKPLAATIWTRARLP